MAAMLRMGASVSVRDELRGRHAPDLREHDVSADEATLAALPIVVELDGSVARELKS